MQTMEAMISLLFLILIITPFLLFEKENRINDSIYRIQLAEDVWRVLYLRGNFEDFKESKRETLEKEMELLGEETSLCIFLDGIEYTNCRGFDQTHSMTVSLTKTIVYDGKPKEMTFSIGN